MAAKAISALQARFGRAFPEQRLFLRSATETRFVRLSPLTQVIGLTGGAVVMGWTIVASAILMMDGIGSGALRDQTGRDKQIYERRLNTLSAERDARIEDARAAHDRFSLALAEVSAMQTRLLTADERGKELETGLAALRDTLRTTIGERDAARARAEALSTELAASETAEPPEAAELAELSATVDNLAEALTRTAGDRDASSEAAATTEQQLAELELDRQLAEERNDRIFQQLEDAVSVSLEPLDEMFKSANLPADRILETVRRGYTGQGGPLTPISFSTSGAPVSPDTLRANEILARLDRVNLYRIAVEKTPFGMPLKAAFRYTSGFGKRWGRMHEGTDMAGATGTPIYATADGVVIHAGKSSGYGNLVKIRHQFGIETRYGHMSRIRVTVGQKISRGDRIGDMGNTGRSTGTHLHYEVRVDGTPVNPMTYIKAARDVF